jgi:phenylalanine-4-hydroxylase
VNPGDPVLQPDGAALSAFQYFENVRNFLVAVQDLGIPTFQASDLEQVNLNLLKKICDFTYFVVSALFSPFCVIQFLMLLISSKLPVLQQSVLVNSFLFNSSR